MIKYYYIMNCLDSYSVSNILLSIPQSLSHLACTCNRIRKIIHNHIILHHLVECHDYESLCEYAIKNDHFDCFMYYVNNNLLPTMETKILSLCAIIVRSNVKYIKYLNEHTNIFKLHFPDYFGLDFNGNIDVCKYLLENNLASPISILMNASSTGDLKCLQYMCSIDLLNDHRIVNSGLLDNAIYYKHYECVKFLHKQGLVIHPYIFSWHSWFTNFKCILYCSLHNANVALDIFVEFFIMLGVLYIIYVYYIIISRRNT